MIEISNKIKFESFKEEEGVFKIQGYAAKFKAEGFDNNNKEKYEKDAYDEFVIEYFKKNKLRIPVYFNHSKTYADWIGEVSYLETNTVGLWVEIQLKPSCPSYNGIVTDIREGRLSHFSTEGWATQWEEVKGGYKIKKASILSISLVMTPSDVAAKFEIKNDLKIDFTAPEEVEEVTVIHKPQIIF